MPSDTKIVKLKLDVIFKKMFANKKNENTLQSLRNYAIIQKYLTEGRHQLCLQQYPRKPAI